MGSLIDRVREIPGRPETGRWLHLTSVDPVTGAVEMMELLEHGGRLHPPGGFPVAYFSEDTEDCRQELGNWLRHERDFETRYTILLAEMCLPRVLDLDDPGIRRRLGLTLATLAESADMSLTQSVGKAAYQAGFRGILYPRPLSKGGLNLVAFCDRNSQQEISIVGARSLTC